MDGLGNPIVFLLSPGNDHDSKHAIPLLSQINIDGSNILGDKAYGAKAIRDYIDSHIAVYTIPNGFAGYLRAMTNLMPRSWRLSTLLLLSFC